MKKIFAIIMTICLMASALCVTTFAAEAMLLLYRTKRRSSLPHRWQSVSDLQSLKMRSTFSAILTLVC